MTQSKLEKAYTTSLDALIKKVKGHYVTEEKITYTLNSNQEKTIKEHIVTKKYYPADLSAIIFVLTNRAPMLWRQKQSENITEIDPEIEVQNLNLAELSETTLREISKLYDKAKNSD